MDGHLYGAVLTFGCINAEADELSKNQLIHMYIEW